MAEARNLVFRITWPETEEGLPLLDPALWPDCKYCVYQLEIGEETNRLHYQGYMEFTGKKRYAWLQRNCDGLEGAHFEVRRGTMEEARNYAMKQDTRVEGPWEWGAPKPGQGSRTDLRQVKRALDEGQSLEYVADNFFGTWLRYNKGLEKYKMMKTVDRDHAMRIILIIGPSGSGKSRWARENFPDAYWKDGTKWWDGYKGQETIIWDEFYGHCCKFSDLLRILDRYPMQVENKGGYFKFTAKTIVFTSNQEPEHWYNAERTHQVAWADNPLNRRIREFGEILRTGEVHQRPPQPQNWDGQNYVNLFPPVIDPENPNHFNSGE